ncbi:MULTISPECIES: NERD domain-containing protein [unclassified Acidovorax]|uniref:NERD domain-containing protein n=1 Tax=unclassified Acidovorax TaxID=2684926 RepID=UPI002883249A|nr:MULTISPECIES: NERD domain-containing protein [unclassified Acidovorax]
MLIKNADDRDADLQALQTLLHHPAITPAQATQIDRQIRNIRAGAKGEADAAYDIDFHHKESKNWAVIHDLRIEYQGRVAQIDHLLISRFMEFWVCESKHFSQGVALNELGEFTSFYAGRPQGIPSPIEQNGRHVAVLQAVLGSSLITLPTRLGFTLKPRFHSLVLISNTARITRPSKPFPGMETVIKSDSLRSTIERRIDKESGLDTVTSVARIVGAETLEQLARQVAQLHRPKRFDWAAKFGLAEVGMAAEPAANRVREPVPVYAPAAPQPVRVQPSPVALPLPVAAPAPVIQPAASTAVAPAAEANADKLTTSRLAARWGLRTAAETLARLEQLGYLVATDGGGYRLTDKAVECGAGFVEKSRHGPYFLWPADLQA